jgi:hypothetical protein
MAWLYWSIVPPREINTSPVDAKAEIIEDQSADDSYAVTDAGYRRILTVGHAG